MCSLMNSVLEMLAGGDLRSDGMGDEVADLVLKNPPLFDDLLDGLESMNEVVRGRTAHALERISRSRPEMIVGCLPTLLDRGQGDKIAMVRWHVAMIYGNLAHYNEFVGAMHECLLDLIQDRSVFVRSWVIVSLCIIGRMYPETVGTSLSAISPLRKDRSIAIRSKASKAVELLTHDKAPFPTGWIKSPHITAHPAFEAT